LKSYQLFDKIASQVWVIDGVWTKLIINLTHGGAAPYRPARRHNDIDITRSLSLLVIDLASSPEIRESVKTN